MVLIDVRNSSHFLPLIPDVIGKSLPADALAYSLLTAARRWNFRFVQASVQAVHLSSKSVLTNRGEESYDALLIASGSETDFRACESWRETSFALDSIDDAIRIRDSFVSNDQAHYVVCGGGYTGVEIASNLQHLIRTRGKSQKVTLVGRAATLCPTLPLKQRLYLAGQIRRSGVELRHSTTVMSREDDRICLSDGSTFSHAELIWGAGVCTPLFVRNLPLATNRQGRLVVDSFLTVSDMVFAAGDTAGFLGNDGPLRMGIQFSLTQGWHAAGNILRRLEGKKLNPYVPFDPGWVVPLANHRACGTILGFPLFGRLPAFLHYFMSVARSIGLGNRLNLIRHLFSA